MLLSPTSRFYGIVIAPWNVALPDIFDHTDSASIQMMHFNSDDACPDAGAGSSQPLILHGKDTYTSSEQLQAPFENSREPFNSVVSWRVLDLDAATEPEHGNCHG